MASIVTCPKCEAQLKFTAEIKSRKVRCSKCKGIITLPVKKATARKTTSKSDFDIQQREKPRKRVKPRETPLRSVTLNRDQEERVYEEVKRDEEIIWIGQPLVKLMMLRGLIASAIALVLAVGGIGLSLLEWGDRLASLGPVLVIVGVVICLGVLFVPPLIQKSKAKNTIYVLTDQRTLIFIGTMGGSEVRSYTRDQIRTLQRSDAWLVENAGDVIFEEVGETGLLSGFRRKRVTHGFLHVAYHKEIQDLVRDVIVDPIGDQRDLMALQPPEADEEDQQEDAAPLRFGAYLGLGGSVLLVVLAIGGLVLFQLTSGGKQALPPIENVDQAFVALAHTEPARVKEGLQFLNEASLNASQKQKLTSSLSSLVTHEAESVQAEAMRLIDRMATPAMVPALLDVLDPSGQSPMTALQKDAVRILARLKDPRGAEAICKYLSTPYPFEDVRAALEQFGPSVEPILLEWMNDPNVRGRTRAREMLSKRPDGLDKQYQQVLSDLKHSDKQRVASAVAWTTTVAEINEKYRPEIYAFFRKAYEKDARPNIIDSGISTLAAVAKWGSKEDVPYFCSMLEVKPVRAQSIDGKPKLRIINIRLFQKKEAIAIGFLTRFPSEIAAEKLVPFLATPHKADVSKALDRMGKTAEPALLKALNSPIEGLSSTVRSKLRAMGVSDTRMVDQTVDDLKSTDKDIRITAAINSVDLPVDKTQAAKLGKNLVSLLKRSSSEEQKFAVLALEKWATADQVEEIAAWIAANPVRGNSKLAEKMLLTLARIRDPRGIIPTVQYILSVQSIGEVARTAILKYGSAAEPAVLAKLATAQVGYRGQLCRILAQIGTKRSLTTLQAIYRQDINNRNVAAAAYQAIQARERNNP